ncbi:unnamed protein product, partial [Owenia fusiformis]
TMKTTLTLTCAVLLFSICQGGVRREAAAGFESCEKKIMLEVEKGWVAQFKSQAMNDFCGMKQAEVNGGSDALASCGNDISADLIQNELIHWGIVLKEKEQECPGLNVDEKIFKYLTPNSVNKVNEMMQAMDALSPAERTCSREAEKKLEIAANSRVAEILADSNSEVTDICDEFINQWEINTIPELEKACNAPSAAMRTIALELPKTIKAIFSPLKGTTACDANATRAKIQ